MSKKKWFSGPPPSVGWWPASSVRDTRALRWWNGSYWSLYCTKHDRIESVAFKAGRKHAEHLEIKWRKRPASWPARSRT